MSTRQIARAAVFLLPLTSAPLIAQEPEPARIRVEHLSNPDGVGLSFAWRFAPGDGPARETPGFDDSRWLAVRPGLARGELPPGGWPGVGWFRRHLLVDPAAQKRAVALRFEAPGAADVYLDGQPVLSAGRGGAPPEVPWARREASLVSLEGHEHVLAIRYVYPNDAASPAGGIGFRISLADPALRSAATEARPSSIAALQGAIVALPLFLAILHLAFFGFDPRELGNLFYALEMAAFALILLYAYRDSLVTSSALRDVLERIGQGMPVVAVLFGTLLYYAVRTNPYPRTWRAYVGGGLVLLSLTYVSPAVAEYGWEVYFLAVVVDVVRLEWSGRVTRRQAPRFFLASFLVFDLMILFQILINADLIRPVAGIRSYYVFGILALAVGTSLSLAHELGHSRLVKAENERKTRELAQARQLQVSMLPRDLPVVPGLDVAAASHTAAEVGGDYYDVRPSIGGGLLVAFGDATGHGLAAGIVVTAVKALFTSLPTDGALPDLLAGCDRVLRGMRLPGLQMCLALARITPREAAIASAGMPPLMVHRARSDTIEELGAGDLPLGSRIPLRCEERRTDLDPGDTLLFASDGFPELLGPDGRELGYPGAADAFRDAARGASARDVVQRLGATAAVFRGARPQDDDVTFVVVRVARE
jgi:serine phosphatase RsbU (regulator of sigma subunit)